MDLDEDLNVEAAEEREDARGEKRMFAALAVDLENRERDVGGTHSSQRDFEARRRHLLVEEDDFRRGDEWWV